MNQLTQHSIDAGTDFASNLSNVSVARQASKGANLGYLLIGGSIGAALALLFAPKAGSEFRTDLSAAAQKGYDSSLDMAQKLMDQSKDLYSTLKDKADQVTGGAASRLEEQVMDKAGSMGLTGSSNTGNADLPNGGGEILEGLSDGGRDQGSAQGSNTGF
jgi:gas vesicle protein